MVYYLLFIARFLNIHRSGVLTALAWLVPHETAAVSAQVMCTPYNHAPCHFMQSHIRKVHACLAVTCHHHFWQNDRDLLHAIAVTGVERRPKWVSTESWPWRRKFSRRSGGFWNQRLFDHEYGALTTVPSPLFGMSKPMSWLYLFLLLALKAPWVDSQYKILNLDT